MSTKIWASLSSKLMTKLSSQYGHRQTVICTELLIADFIREISVLDLSLRILSHVFRVLCVMMFRVIRCYLRINRMLTINNWLPPNDDLTATKPSIYIAFQPPTAHTCAADQRRPYACGGGGGRGPNCNYLVAYKWLGVTVSVFRCCRCSM